LPESLLLLTEGPQQCYFPSEVPKVATGTHPACQGKSGRTETGAVFQLEKLPASMDLNSDDDLGCAEFQPIT